MRDPPFAVAFGAVARRDLVSVQDWLLSNRGQGAATAFTEAVDAVLKRIALLPESGHPVWTGATFSQTLRRVGLAKTGYWLYYRLDLGKCRIRVLRCRHEKQRPLRWKG